MRSAYVRPESRSRWLGLSALDIVLGWAKPDTSALPKNAVPLPRMLPEPIFERL